MWHHFDPTRQRLQTANKRCRNIISTKILWFNKTSSNRSSKCENFITWRLIGGKNLTPLSHEWIQFDIKSQSANTGPSVEENIFRFLLNFYWRKNILIKVARFTTKWNSSDGDKMISAACLTWEKGAHTWSYYRTCIKLRGMFMMWNQLWRDYMARLNFVAQIFSSHKLNFAVVAPGSAMMLRPFPAPHLVPVWSLSVCSKALENVPAQKARQQSARKEMEISINPKQPRKLFEKILKISRSRN